MNDQAAYYVGDGEPDEEVMTYAVKQAGSGPELCACGRADREAGAGRVLEGVLADMAVLRGAVAALADRVAALELERVAERGEL